MIRDIRLIGQLEHANNWPGGSSSSRQSLLSNNLAHNRI